jgi:putative transcriptional regulator
MKNGLLYASKQPQSANGTVVSDTPKGEDAGVSGLEGIITHRESTVLVCKVPRVERGGSRNVRLDALKDVISRVTVVACVALRHGSPEEIDRFLISTLVHVKDRWRQPCMAYPVPL